MSSMKLKEIVAASGVQFGTSGARGLVVQMTKEVCYAYTQGFIRSVAGNAQQIVIGHDLRPSSPEIASFCAEAVRDAGLGVIFVGALPTPAVAYYASTLKVPSIIITGSHIPFDRNGIKFYRADGEISKSDEQAMLDSAVGQPAAIALQTLPPVDKAAALSYVERYTGFFAADALQGMRVAVYEHSSVARDLLRTILESLGAEVLSLGRTDTFVPIDTEAVRAEDIVQARQWAKEYRFDAILSTDGDADRPLIGDEQGSWLRGDVVGVLCAQYLGADVVATPVSSNTVVEKCGAFRQVLRTRIGSPYVIAAMEQARSSLENNTALLVGYEANGGFLLGSNVQRDGRHMSALPTRDAILPMLALLAMTRQRGCALSSLSSELPKRYTASDRVQNYPTEASRELLVALNQDFKRAAALLAPDAGQIVEVNNVDGLRAIFDNGDIVHLRPSGNAPELRCYAEADSMDHANALCAGCLTRVSTRHG